MDAFCSRFREWTLGIACRSRFALGMLATAIAALATPQMALAQAASHGIGVSKGTDPSLINIGDPYRSFVRISNSALTDSALDTLVVSSIVDTIASATGPQVSGNLLPTATLSEFVGGATCNVGQTLCTLPTGSSFKAVLVPFYNVTAADFALDPVNHRLTDTVQVFFRDLCDGQSTNCNPVDLLVNQGGASLTIAAACSVVIEKTAARDDNCDKVADGPFSDTTVQDADKCVVYRICVTNTGQQTLDATGVQVTDAFLGTATINFGTIPPAVPPATPVPVCRLISSQVTATRCTGPGGSCVCDAVRGVNTATVSSAICQATGDNACIQPGSDCEDTTPVDCCAVRVDKQIACVAGGPFFDARLVLNNEDGTNGPPPCLFGDTVYVRYQVQNVGQVPVNNCTLAESNLTIQPGGTVQSGFGIVAGPPLPPVNASGTPTCRDAVAGGEPDTATLSCACVQPPTLPPLQVQARDLATVSCVGEAICRTPGFWGTHARANRDKRRSQNITQAVINAGGGSLQVCGECISTTVPVNNAASAVEAICVSPSGAIVLQNARQLTAMALNCVISGFGADCSGDAALDGLFTDCNNACLGLASTRDNSRCRDEIDCFNNGGQYHAATGFCQKGTCANGDPCGDGRPCIDFSACTPLPGNCHDRILVNEALGLDFDPPGPAGSSADCNAAHDNNCAVLPLTCSASNGSGEACCGTDSCP